MAYGEQKTVGTPCLQEDEDASVMEITRGYPRSEQRILDEKQYAV